MNKPLLLVAVPDRLSRLLGAALQLHPALRVRDGVRIQQLREQLDIHTRTRVHSDRLPWDQRSDWVDQVVDSCVAGIACSNDPRRSVWRARDATTAARIARALDATPVVWIGDPRHGVDLGSEDPIGDAARCGAGWSRASAAARDLGGAVDVTVSATASGQRLLTALRLADHAPTLEALALLPRLPPPALSPALLGALAASPPVAAFLRNQGTKVPDPPEHPVVLQLRAAVAPRPDERIGLARRCIALEPDPTTRGKALELLIDAGEALWVRSELIRWIRAEDAPEAWEQLLTDRTGPPEAAWVSAARHHHHPRVRAALGRWLVLRGLDRQAAETVCRLRGIDWFTGLHEA
ncbi:MAG: hypothetical protein VX265_15240 [Myxococcota bacterium]|nr:hypothetical protein [Myxococcota bacterium]